MLRSVLNLAGRRSFPRRPPTSLSSLSCFLSTDATTTTTNESSAAFEKIACIGAGKMAQAVLEPVIKSGLQPASQIAVYDVSTETVEQVRQDLHVKGSNDIADCIDGADLIVCAVKPQNLTPGFFQEFRKAQDVSNPQAIFLSVIAGKTTETLQQAGFDKIVRSMPNTPAMIGQGMTVWSCTDAVTSAERSKIRDVLCSCGKTMYVDDESFIDTATSISGSGPAYIFMLMESMIDAGVHMGFPRDKATTLVYHTMLGSTLYAMETGQHPAILRNSVTSPNGTTASALYELENGKFRTVIKDAMWACYRRSLEMGQHDSNVGPGRTQVNVPNGGDPDSHKN